MANFTVTRNNIKPGHTIYVPSKDDFLKFQNLKKSIKIETTRSPFNPDFPLEPYTEITKYTGMRTDLEKMHKFISVENTEYAKYCKLNNITRSITDIID